MEQQLLPPHAIPGEPTYNQELASLLAKLATAAAQQQCKPGGSEPFTANIQLDNGSVQQCHVQRRLPCNAQQLIGSLLTSKQVFHLLAFHNQGQASGADQLLDSVLSGASRTITLRLKSALGDVPAGCPIKASISYDPNGFSSMQPKPVGTGVWLQTVKGKLRIYFCTPGSKVLKPGDGAAEAGKADKLPFWIAIPVGRTYVIRRDLGSLLQLQSQQQSQQQSQAPSQPQQQRPQLQPAQLELPSIYWRLITPDMYKERGKLLDVMGCYLGCVHCVVFGPVKTPYASLQLPAFKPLNANIFDRSAANAAGSSTAAAAGSTIGTLGGHLAGVDAPAAAVAATAAAVGGATLSTPAASSPAQQLPSEIAVAYATDHFIQRPLQHQLQHVQGAVQPVVPPAQLQPLALDGWAMSPSDGAAGLQPPAIGFATAATAGSAAQHPAAAPGAIANLQTDLMGRPAAAAAAVMAEHPMQQDQPEPNSPFASMLQLLNGSPVPIPDECIVVDPPSPDELDDMLQEHFQQEYLEQPLCQQQQHSEGGQRQENAAQQSQQQSQPLLYQAAATQNNVAAQENQQQSQAILRVGAAAQQNQQQNSAVLGLHPAAQQSQQENPALLGFVASPQQNQQQHQGLLRQCTASQQDATAQQHQQQYAAPPCQQAAPQQSQQQQPKAQLEVAAVSGFSSLEAAMLLLLQQQQQQHLLLLELKQLLQQPKPQPQLHGLVQQQPVGQDAVDSDYDLKYELLAVGAGVWGTGSLHLLKAGLRQLKKRGVQWWRVSETWFLKRTLLHLLVSEVHVFGPIDEVKLNPSSLTPEMRLQMLQYLVGHDPFGFACALQQRNKNQATPWNTACHFAIPGILEYLVQLPELTVEVMLMPTKRGKLFFQVMSANAASALADGNTEYYNRMEAGLNTTLWALADRVRQEKMAAGHRDKRLRAAGPAAAGSGV